MKLWPNHCLSSGMLHHRKGAPLVVYEGRDNHSSCFLAIGILLHGAATTAVIPGPPEIRKRCSPRFHRLSSCACAHSAFAVMHVLWSSIRSPPDRGTFTGDGVVCHFTMDVSKMM